MGCPRFKSAKYPTDVLTCLKAGLSLLLLLKLGKRLGGPTWVDTQPLMSVNCTWSCFSCKTTKIIGPHFDNSRHHCWHHGALDQVETMLQRDQEQQLNRRQSCQPWLERRLTENSKDSATWLLARPLVTASTSKPSFNRLLWRRIQCLLLELWLGVLCMIKTPIRQSFDSTLIASARCITVHHSNRWGCINHKVSRRYPCVVLCKALLAHTMMPTITKPNPHYGLHRVIDRRLV